MDKSKTKFEDYLNELIADTLSWEDAMEAYGYLSKDGVVSRNFHNRTLGTLLRTKDPIAFNVAYQDWVR